MTVSFWIELEYEQFDTVFRFRLGNLKRAWGIEVQGHFYLIWYERFTLRVNHFLCQRNKDSRFLQLALSYGGDPNVLGGMFEVPPIDDTIDADDEVIPANYFLLIDAGTDISIKGKFDSTLLSQAASRGRYDVVLDLLNRGAEYQTINKIGRNPLYYWIAKHEAVYKSDSRIYKNKKLVEQWFISRGINYKINNK